MSVATLPWLEENQPRDLMRWAIAALVVLTIHAGAVAYYLLWHQPEVDIGDDVSSVALELAPIDSTPDAVERDVAPAPETMIESKAVPQQQKPPEQEEAKVEPPPPLEESPMAIPEPRPKQPEKVEEARPPAPMTAQRVKGGAARIEPSWQSTLVKRLQHYKRYPSEAQARNEQGVVLLSFSLDRNGHVLASRIARSSGYAALDQEVLAMITRAEPLPPFPSTMPQQRLDLTVPIRFSLR